MRKKDLIEKIIFKKKLLKKFKEAIFHYNMIKEGDRILIGFSGGKDSTALAIFLQYFKLSSKVNFEFETLTVNYGMGGETYRTQINQLKELGIKVNESKTNIFELSKTKMNPDSSFCSFFSRMRRGKLTEYARENNFNKIALGHHLDDAAESLMMGIMNNGVIRSLPPIYKNKHNQVLIRPLILEREKVLAEFCRLNNLITIGDEMCPGMCLDLAKTKVPTARVEVKESLSMAEKKNPQLFSSIESALQNVNENALLQKEKLKFFNNKKKFFGLF